MTPLSKDTVHDAVREQYAKVAKAEDSACGCTPSSCCGESSSTSEMISLELGYSRQEVGDVPEGANMGLGCGNPQVIASLKPGETVLDLGSGGGFDCFLAAREVGKTGLVIGVDMTPEMVSKARRNAIEAGFDNIHFRLGEIENLPVADCVVDVIISNCVINLSPEKAEVFQESFRVLRPGGRLAISDIVATAELPESIKNDMALLTGCMAGASSIADIENMLISAGFERVEIKPKDESRKFIQDWAPDKNIEDYVVSATIQATKPKV